MPATYQPIATVTVSGTPTEVEFTAIPATFTDLVIIANAQSNASGSSVNSMRFRINTDTGTNYSHTELAGDGSSVSSARVSNNSYIDIGVMTQTSATYFVTNIIQVQNYSNTTTNKTVLSRWNAASVNLGFVVGLWRSTAAINRIVLYRDGTQTIKAGSTFTLYGIKAA